jgi:hypothetical protein
MKSRQGYNCTDNTPECGCLTPCSHLSATSHIVSSSLPISHRAVFVSSKMPQGDAYSEFFGDKATTAVSLKAKDIAPDDGAAEALVSTMRELREVQSTFDEWAGSLDQHSSKELRPAVAQLDTVRNLAADMLRATRGMQRVQADFAQEMQTALRHASYTPGRRLFDDPRGLARVGYQLAEQSCALQQSAEELQEHLRTFGEAIEEAQQAIWRKSQSWWRRLLRCLLGICGSVLGPIAAAVNPILGALGGIVGGVSVHAVTNQGMDLEALLSRIPDEVRRVHSRLEMVPDHQRVLRLAIGRGVGQVVRMRDEEEIRSAAADWNTQFQVLMQRI